VVAAVGEGGGGLVSSGSGVGISSTIFKSIKNMEGKKEENE